MRGGPRGAPWTPQDRLLMLGLEAYEQDLCPGCGWPRTYTMHKEAKGHWHGSNAIRCQGCTAKAAAEDAYNDGPTARRGVYFAARPSEGMAHAMTDPILTYEDDTTRPVTGASGVTYLPTTDPKE